MPKDEKKRRKLNRVVDEEPSVGQILNYRFIKPYIRNKRVLDVGCWSGQIEKLAIKDVREISGIDPGQQAIEFAKKEVPRAHFKLATIDNIPFKNNSFEVVLLLEVLEHIPKGTELAGLKEINRVLKKDGYLLLTTPNNNLRSVLFDPAYFIIGHRHYTVKRLRYFLEKSGFEIKDISIRGKFTQAVFNNFSLIVKHLLNKKIKEDWFKKPIEMGYRPGGFLTICVVARKITKD